MEYKLLKELEDKIREDILKAYPELAINILSAGIKKDCEVMMIIIHKLKGKCYSTELWIQDNLDISNPKSKSGIVKIMVNEIKQFIEGKKKDSSIKDKNNKPLIKIESFEQLQKMAKLKKGEIKSFILVATMTPKIKDSVLIPDTFFFAELDVNDLTPIMTKLNELTE